MAETSSFQLKEREKLTHRFEPIANYRAFFCSRPGVPVVTPAVAGNPVRPCVEMVIQRKNAHPQSS
jgi:hypothetical protein